MPTCPHLAWMAVLTGLMVVSPSCEKRQNEYREPIQRTHQEVRDGRPVQYHHHYYEAPKQTTVVHHHDYDHGLPAVRQPNPPRDRGRTVRQDVVTYDHNGRSYEQTHQHHFAKGAQIAEPDATTDVYHEHHHHYGRSQPDPDRERQAERGEQKPTHTSTHRVREADGKVHEHRHKYHAP